MDMNRLKKISKKDYEYSQYTDYVFKGLLQKPAD